MRKRQYRSYRQNPAGYGMGRMRSAALNTAIIPIVTIVLTAPTVIDWLPSVAAGLPDRKVPPYDLTEQPAGQPPNSGVVDKAEHGSAPPVGLVEQHVVLHCDFGPTWDKNYDRWPDGWKRRRGPGYPHYLKVEVAPSAGSPAGRALQIHLNGGAAAVFAPAVAVAPEFDYVLEGRARADSVVRSAVFASLAFEDQQQQTLRLVRSKPIPASGRWESFRIGPVEPPCEEKCSAVIGFHVEPPDSLHPDLEGTVELGSVRLVRVPRVRVRLSRASGLYRCGEPIVATCSASGLACEDLSVHFLLEDIEGTEVASTVVPAVAETIPSALAEEKPNEAPEPAGTPRRFSATWKLPDLSPGYYRLRAHLAQQREIQAPRVVGLAVLDGGPLAADLQFGWTIAQSHLPLTCEEMAWVLRHSATGKLRCPAQALLGHSADNSLVQLLGNRQFRRANRQVVVVLEGLPDQLAKQFPGTESLLEVLVFPEEQWAETLEGYVRPIAPHVSWWQIGGDGSTQLVGYRRAAETLAAVERTLLKVSPSVQMGTVWDIAQPLPEQLGPPLCDFLVFHVPYQTTSTELAKRLAAIRRQQATVPLWVVLQPDPKHSTPPAQRAKKLIEKMIAARATSGTTAIFLPDVFDQRFGIIEPGGEVGPLLVAWHNAVRFLSGRYLGSISLPGGSNNMVFSRRTDAVMVVWNDTPAGTVSETLVLGSNVKQIDPWGRNLPVRSGPQGQQVVVGPVPTFVVGLNPYLVAWRQQCRLAPSTLPSIPGQSHTTILSIANVFTREISGSATITAPQGWLIEPSELRFRLLPGESTEQQLRITLPFDAACGLHPLSIDFSLQEVANGRFRVFRQIDVQPEGLHIQIDSHLNGQEQLQVTAEISNLSQRPLSLRCHLFVPGRRRSTQLVSNLQQGTKSITFRLDDGRKLIGQTLWLRVEQIGGSQVLNYRFTAAP